MPIGGPGSGGGGGGGGGNANNTVLLRQDGEDDKGLLFTASGADDSWHLRAEAKGDDDPPIGGHVDLPLFISQGVDRRGSLRLQFPADVTGFAGADSNNIRVRLFRNDSFVRNPTVSWNAANGLLVILLGRTVAASDVRTAIDGLSGITIENSITGTGLGSDTLVLPAQNNRSADYNLVGGSDTIPAGIELLALPEDGVNGPHILVKYDAGDQDLQGLYDELAENDQGVSITVPYGTDLTAAPEPTPFVRGFYEGDGGESPTTGTGGLTQGQVDGRVRILTKGYALRGGPDVPDSEIGSEVTRDSEVKPYALVGGGQVPDGDIPGTIARDSEIEPWAKPGGGDVPEDRIPDDITRDSELKSWARVGGGNVPEAQIDSRIARDSEVEAGDDAVREHTLASQRFDSGTGEFVTVTEGGTERRTAIPTGGTQVAANPDGSDGDVLRRIAIGGTNFVIDADVPVGMATILGRVTSTEGKHPADLPDHTNPIRVPIPTYGDLTDAESPGGDAAAWKAASREWPVVPLTSISEDGGFLSSLDTNEGSVVFAEGMYILGLRAQNVWLDNIEAGNSLSGQVQSTDMGNPRVGANNRLNIQMLVEYWDADNSAWAELSVSNSPYTRRTLYANQVTANGGSTSTEAPGSDDANDGTGDADYDGRISHVAATMYAVVTVPPGGLTLRCRMKRGNGMLPAFAGSVEIAYDSEGFPLKPSTGNNRNLGNIDGGTMAWGYFCDVPAINVFPLGRPVQTEPLAHRPHISSYELNQGDQTPVAGSIAGERYEVHWSIAQTDHVGAARIIGFKGAYGDGTGAVVIHDIPGGGSAPGHPHVNWASSGVVFSIPQGVTLAAGETYTLRLQVFEEGVSNPSLTQRPGGGYADIVIVAHAAAAAAYRVGYIGYDANDADAAATAARIAAGGTDTATSNALPNRITIAIPSAADATDEFQMYLLAKDGETQPSNFTSAGLPANSSFYAAEDVSRDSIDYKAYILRPNRRVTKADNGDFFGVS